MMSFCTEQESTYKKVGIIGCGAAGGLCALLLTKNPDLKVFAFDSKLPFATLLPTGGGRCNISYFQPDVREFVKNYPRGEKFLLSVFSRFGVQDTVKMFESFGIKTYVQEDNRIFPVTDSSEKTVDTLRTVLNKSSNFNFIKEKVIDINNSQNGFCVKTNTNNFFFDYLVIATGGKGNGTDFAQKTGHNVIPAHPSLCSLHIEQEFLYNLKGITFKNVKINFKTDKKYSCEGDIMFSDKFATGPGIFKVSSLLAFYDFSSPVEITLQFNDISNEEIENEIKNNTKKSIKNVFSKFIYEKFISVICEEYGIDSAKKASQIKKSEKTKITESITGMKIHITNRVKNSEIVTAGGIDLNCINPDSMQSKKIDNLYFIGEVLNIDAYTGGFNLQNCWSGAYLCAEHIIRK